MHVHMNKRYPHTLTNKYILIIENLSNICTHTFIHVYIQQRETNNNSKFANKKNRKYCYAESTDES